MKQKRLRAIVLWVDLRDPNRFEGQVYLYALNKRLYFNYSVWDGPVGPWRDAPVDVLIDDTGQIEKIG